MIEWILSSSVLIVVVALIRLLLKGRLSLRLQYALWGLVLLRLLIPVSFGSSPISVSNVTSQFKPETSHQSISENKVAPDSSTQDEYVQQDKAPEQVESPSAPVQQRDGAEESYPNQPQQSHTPDSPDLPVEEPEIQIDELQIPDGTEDTTQWLEKAAWGVWIAGMVAVGLCFAGANLVFAHRMKRSRVAVENMSGKLPVFVTEAVESPCLFGVFCPAIYLNPQALSDQKLMRHSIVHETTHYMHGDHVWAVLRCVCLAVHWYNPLVWLAAFLSKRDAELACDESSIIQLGEQERAEYGQTLISMTCSKKTKKLILSTTMTDSGGGLQERIRLIARKPKMAAYTLLAVILIAAIAVGCTFTGGKNDNRSDRNVPTADTTDPTASTQLDQTTDSTEPPTVQSLPVKRIWDEYHPDDTEKNRYFCIKEDRLGGALIERRSDGKIYVDGEPLLDEGVKYSYCVGFYLADLTGDGNYELCLSTGEGGGLVVQRIEIFDFETMDCIYSLSDFSKHDYYLFSRDGKLCVNETQFSGGDTLRTGVLIFDGTEISVSWDEIPDTSYDSNSLLDSGSVLDAWKTDTFCIAVLPTENSNSMESHRYIIPGEQLPFVDALEAALEHRIEKVSYDYPNGEDSGWMIEYEGITYRVYTDGTIMINNGSQGAIPPEYSYPVYELCKRVTEEAGLFPVVRPYELTDIRSATLEWNGTHTITDGTALNFLEMRFSNSVYQSGGAACPFDALLTLELGNGRTVQLRMATDECAAWMSEGVAYAFKVLTEDGYKDNTEFYRLFATEVIHELSYGDGDKLWSYMRYMDWARYDAKYGAEKTLALMDRVRTMVQNNPEKYGVNGLLYAANGLDGYMTEGYATVLSQFYAANKKTFANYCLKESYVENADLIIDMLGYGLGVSSEEIRTELEGFYK